MREVEQRLRVADRIAACISDPRAPDQITHAPAEIIRFRLLMIAAGYEDGNDADTLRSDPMFKMALDLTPSGRELCSQSTISRLENLPDVRALLRMGRAMVDLYSEVVFQGSQATVLDVDDTFDAVHGDQQLRLFNAHYDQYGFQPIVVFDGGGRFITAVLRPAEQASGKEIKPFLRGLVRAIRARWPNTEILLRADSHYCGAEIIDWCRANGLDYILGVAPTTTLRRHVEGLEARVKASFEGAPTSGKIRRFMGFFDRTKAGAASRDYRPGRSRRRRARHALRRHQSEQTKRSRALRGCLLPARPGQKPYQILEEPSGRRSHVLLPGDGQSVSAVPALRRVLADVGPTRVDAETFDVARRPVRHAAPAPHQVAARVLEMKTMIRVHLPTSCPAQDILRFALGRIPRLVT